MTPRTIFFLRRENPERYKVVATHPRITAEAIQPPKTFLGISISASEVEISQSLGLPVLRHCLATDQAFTDQKEMTSQFIALLCLKPGVDRSILHTCSLEEALALCETYDT